MYKYFPKTVSGSLMDMAGDSMQTYRRLRNDTCTFHELMSSTNRSLHPSCLVRNTVTSGLWESALKGHGLNFLVMIVEPRSEFLGRCDRAVTALNERFPFRPRTAIVIVSHAAACVGLTRAAANATLQDVNAAGPCSIFRLERSSSSGDVWELPHYATKSGMNAYSEHLSEIGTTTVPWNHFGDKKINKGYTGPPIERDDLSI